MSTSLYAKLDWALSPMAIVAVEALVKSYNLDRDLAIAMLEEFWPEGAVYCLEEECYG